MLIIIKVIKIIIIVIKTTKTVIVLQSLQLLKIVVQSHNHKTYIRSNSDNAQQEFKTKIFIAQHCRTKCNATKVSKIETFKNCLQY